MRHLPLIITLLCLCALAPQSAAQELNATVEINTKKVEGTSRNVFDNLKTTLTQFINDRQWTPYKFDTNERIKCTFSIIVNKYDESSGTMTCDAYIQSVRPVYNSTYTTTALSMHDANFSFDFREYDQLEFRDDQVDKNLTALIAYYSYLIIGINLDTMAPEGGTDVLQKALDLVNNAQNLNTKGWKAMEDDGNHVLIYTGVIEKNGIQHQCMAIGDGIEYRKDDFNPIISSKNIPFEYDVAHFRDPKAWKENGIYYIAAVIKTEDKSGAIALFSSNNLESWEFVSIIDRSACSLGMMWECPDVFSLDGCDVIIVSPQEMKEDLEKGWHDGNNSVYMTGTLPRDTWEFKRNNVCQIDYGIDFYAPQTTLLPDGRRVLVAWMHSWESYSTPENYSWTGMMTLPRELEIKNGILFQKPVSELEALRKDKISGSEQLDFCSDGISIPKICGRHFDMGLTLNNVSSDSGWFRIHFAEDENFFTEIKIDFTNKEISFDRSRSGTRKECENFRKFKFSISSVEKFDVRLVCDINSAELFVLGGRYAFTNVFYTPSSADGISFASEKQICFDYEFYSLK